TTPRHASGPPPPSSPPAARPPSTATTPNYGCSSPASPATPACAASPAGTTRSRTPPPTRRAPPQAPFACSRTTKSDSRANALPDPPAAAAGVEVHAECHPELPHHVIVLHPLLRERHAHM